MLQNHAPSPVSTCYTPTTLEEMIESEMHVRLHTVQTLNCEHFTLHRIPTHLFCKEHDK